MAGTWRADMFQSSFLLGGGLMVIVAFAQPDLSCPEFVTRYAPIIWLHSDDPYMPSDIGAHIRHTTPILDGKPLRDHPSLDLDNLEVLNKYGDQVALTSDDDPTSYPSWLLGEAPDSTGRIHNSTACSVILVERSPSELDAFYFYFYSYNEGANITQVVEPLDNLVSGKKADSGIHFGNHVGDWEHNMIRFRDGEPIGIYYSQHVDGEAYAWGDSVVSRAEERPVVYSARGSHANYATSGDHIHSKALIDYCDAGQKWDPVLSANFYRFDPLTFTLTRLAGPNESTTAPPASNETSFFYFKGRWGDAQYPNSDPRQETTPYFGLRRFETGPNGPRFKHLVRKGIAPEKRVESWLEWGVGVFLTLYPYCFKGWRLWVSAALVVMLIVTALLGIRCTIEKYRGKSYHKIGQGDIRLDDWSTQEEGLVSASEADSDDDSDD